jgi:hypothetical protein
MNSLLSGVMMLVIVGVVLYLIFRPKASGAGKDAYYYIISFMALVLLYWAAADVVRVILERLWNSGTYYGGDLSTILQKISLRLSTFVVGFPVWAFHWYKAVMKKEADIDISSRKSYATAILFISTLIILGAGTGLVYQGFNALLGIGKDAEKTLAYLIPYTALAVGMWLMHYKMWAHKRNVVENNLI